MLNLFDKKREIEYKKAVIFEAFKEFYKSAAKELDVPYFICARNSFNENIKTIKDVNSWYNRIMEYAKNDY
jgi:hypothetical protein